jgi:hypothetical protein
VNPQTISGRLLNSRPVFNDSDFFCMMIFAEKRLRREAAEKPSALSRANKLIEKK